uniref:Uncharacterized protein n=1 Tax=Anguilla anguilla TaxID=7936 RepID=A0A0E9VCW6_ANGAN
MFGVKPRMRRPEPLSLSLQPADIGLILTSSFFN